MPNWGSITLNNGVVMPKFGLGTWLSEPGKVKEAVETAIDAGYRHIDCAYCYGNEHEVGEAIENKIKAGVVKREDLFITGKLWLNFHNPKHVEEGLDASLKDLKTDYLDLYLIHWPMKVKMVENRDKFPQKDGKMWYDEDDTNFEDTWLELERIYKAGKKLKAIGVSNYTIDQLKDLIAKGTVVPAMNQLECHAYLNQSEMVEYCRSVGIAITGYSPLGSPNRPPKLQYEDNAFVLMEEPVVLQIAEAHKKSAAQVLIRFALQRDIVCIPKSVTASRIVSNSEVTDFELSSAEMDKLMGLNRNCRYLAVPHFNHSKYYPFKGLTFSHLQE